MKKLVVFAALLAFATFGFANSAKADTTSAGGVTYTFTSGGPDGSGGFDVFLTIDTSNATASGTLNSFSVQFTGATNISLVSSPAGTGAWTVAGMGPNTGNGCNINGSADHFCINGGSIGVTAGTAGGTFTFEFDVTGGGNPTTTHIQAFQGEGALAISNDVGIGSPTTSTPEPASMLLLGLGLAGVPFLRRKK
jgi:hypothetical protein